MTSLRESEWPAARVGEALLSFLPSGRAPPAAPPPLPQAAECDPVGTCAWIESAARQLGLEALAVDSAHAELFKVLLAARTALLLLPGDGQPRYLVLQGARGKRLLLLGADYVTRAVTWEAVAARLFQEAEAQLAPEIDGVLSQAQSLRDSAQLRASLLAERLRHVRIELGWLVRTPARGPLRTGFLRAGVGSVLVAFLTAHLASYGAWILAWLAVADDALEGRLDPGWLTAGALMLVAFAALRITADWLQSVLSLRLGVLLRQRLFEGALALDPQSARGDGVGQFLGRIYEAEALEQLAISGGLTATTATLELLAALLILVWGAQSWGLGAVLLLSMLVCASIGLRYLQARGQWTNSRRALTHQLIERMVGHRTRLAQEDSRHWHDEEDLALSAYSAESRRLDSSAVWLSLVPRSWLIVGTLGLGWAFSTGDSTHSLAIIIAAILMAFESFRNLSQGVPHLADAMTAWKEAAPLLAAAATDAGAAAGHAVVPSRASGADRDSSHVEAQGIDFHTPASGRLVLRDINLTIGTGDRILLEGPSGGGKSTLATLLAGLRRPQQGLLLLNGLDLATLGEVQWRRRVALAAQFHENHVVSETFAFNLLMGRGWPPTGADMDLAESICREIGLGDLLERMPSGLDQQVGESGWQLSHGERSRLYLARALLQDAELVILDESFAALDPENLRQALDSVLRRARSVMVVAHP